MADTEKVQFAINVRNLVTDLARCAEGLTRLAAVFPARGYAGGGANPMTDADLAGTGMTLNDMLLVAYMAVELNKFLDNQPVTTGDRRSVVNKIRVDV